MRVSRFWALSVFFVLCARNHLSRFFLNPMPRTCTHMALPKTLPKHVHTYTHTCSQTLESSLEEFRNTCLGAYRDFSLSLSLSLTLFLSLSLTHTHTHTYARAHTHTHTHTQALESSEVECRNTCICAYCDLSAELHFQAWTLHSPTHPLHIHFICDIVC